MIRLVFLQENPVASKEAGIATVLQLFAKALLIMRSSPALKPGVTVCYNLH